MENQREGKIEWSVLESGRKPLLGNQTASRFPGRTGHTCQKPWILEPNSGISNFEKELIRTPLHKALWEDFASRMLLFF